VRADEASDAVAPLQSDPALLTAGQPHTSDHRTTDIGQRLLLAARTRGWSAPILLCKAYATDFAAAAGTTEAVAAPLIIAAESEFRHQIELYGTALTQEDPVGALSQQGADLAKLLVAAELGIVVDIPVDLMTEILDTAVDLVRDDYAAEVAATVAHVKTELEAHGVTRAAF